MNAEDDDDPPPLTDTSRQRESSVGSGATDPLSVNDELTSLNAPIDDELGGGEFRQSIEDPPPLALAEFRKRSEAEANRLSIDQVWDYDIADPLENPNIAEQPPEDLEYPTNEAKRNSDGQGSTGSGNQRQPSLPMDPNESTNRYSQEVYMPNQQRTSVSSEDPDKQIKRMSEDADTSGQGRTSIPQDPDNSFRRSSQEAETTNEARTSIPQDNHDNSVRRSSQEAETTNEGRTSFPQDQDNSVWRSSQEAESTNQGRTSIPQDPVNSVKRPSQEHETTSQGRPSVPQDPNPSSKRTSRESPEVCNRVNEMLDTCDMSGCQPQKITLGEPEKEQLIAAGQHILEIGQQLLYEMNFVEGVLNSFGGFSRGPNSTPCSPGKMSLTERHESLRSYIAQGKRLSWQDQEKLKEESKLAAKAAKFGSGFESPHLSSTAVQDTATCRRGSGPATSGADANTNTTQTPPVDPEFRKRLASLEIKIESMNSKLEVCEKQVKDVYGTLCGALNKLSEETACLRQQISQESEQGATLRSSIEEKISCFEQQIMKLAKALWELRCETKAQMHFGQFDC